jgi:predicted DNA-binding WGR domain protein
MSYHTTPFGAADVVHWRTSHWVRIDEARNERRLYTLRLQQDLFGQWEVVRCWGRLGHQGGSERATRHFSRVAATEAYDIEIKRRQARRYRQLESIGRGPGGVLIGPGSAAASLTAAFAR